MHILRWTWITLAVCGCVRPSSWSSPTRRFLYNVYTVFVLIMVCSFLFSQILDVIFVVNNTNDLIDNTFATVAIIVACYKMFYFLLNREAFKSVLNTLNKEPFLPLNEEENGIQSRFDELSEFNAIVYTILIESLVLLLCSTTFIRDFTNRKLTLRAWIPYNYSSLPLYLVTFYHQVIALMFAALVNVAFDTLFSSLLIHTSCQLEILGCRLNNIAKSSYQSPKQCARHHECIYKFASMVNASFKSIMGYQFLASLLTVCFSLYRLTQNNFGMKYIEALFVLFCFTMEILYYCWYGNEVKLKGNFLDLTLEAQGHKNQSIVKSESVEISDAIFASDWVSLNINTKKSLLMIMQRSAVPIQYNSIHVVTMDLESFMVLIKTSYSAYNMLTNSKTD